MSVPVLFEPELARPGGFFSFLYSALRRERGAVLSSDPRPLPQQKEPREHVSAWIEMEGDAVLVDMSDHVFLLDLEALKHCTLYLKSNLHRPTLKRLLAEGGCPELETKVKPFFSFAGFLDAYLKPDPLRDLYRLWKGGSEDLCDVVGVYEHLRRDGERSVYAEQGPELTPNRVHYWARVHTLEALREAGFSGCLRLTSRYQQDLEDGDLIQSNLSQRAYRRAILRARMLVINTLPHALLPWKASECLALGRPFVVDVPPLMEQAQPFALQEGDHYMALLPPLDFSDDQQGRVLSRLSIDQFREGAERLRELMQDPGRMQHMEAAARNFRNQALKPATLVSYIEACLQELR